MALVDDDALTTEERLAKARQRQELDQLQRDEDLRAVLSTEAGRRWLWRLLEEECLLLQDIYDVEPRAEARMLGRRALGIHLLAEAQRVSAGAYQAMVLEEAKAAREKAIQEALEAARKAVGR